MASTRLACSLFEIGGQKSKKNGCRHRHFKSAWVKNGPSTLVINVWIVKPRCKVIRVPPSLPCTLPITRRQLVCIRISSNSGADAQFLRNTKKACQLLCLLLQLRFLKRAKSHPISCPLLQKTHERWWRALRNEGLPFVLYNPYAASKYPVKSQRPIQMKQHQLSPSQPVGAPFLRKMAIAPLSFIKKSETPRVFCSPFVSKITTPYT